MQKLTGPQKKKIFAVAREIGIDNDLIHEMIEARYKKEHISDLTATQAGQLIDFMERQKGSSNRSTTSPDGKVVSMATKEQLWKIDQLVKELGWQDNPKRLRGFCKKYAKTDDPKFLTKAQAWRLIEGLKKVAARQDQAEAQ